MITSEVLSHTCDFDHDGFIFERDKGFGRLDETILKVRIQNYNARDKLVNSTAFTGLELTWKLNWFWLVALSAEFWTDSGCNADATCSHLSAKGRRSRIPIRILAVHCVLGLQSSHQVSDIQMCSLIDHDLASASCLGLYPCCQVIARGILSFNSKVEHWGNHLAGNIYDIGNPTEPPADDRRYNMMYMDSNRWSVSIGFAWKPPIYGAVDSTYGSMTE